MAGALRRCWSWACWWGASVQRLAGIGSARVSPTVLLIGIGARVSAAALLVLGGVRASSLRGVRGAVAPGAASGFMNAAAGVGGAAISLYALNTGWTAQQFVPNARLYGVLVNAVSIAAKACRT